MSIENPNAEIVILNGKPCEVRIPIDNGFLCYMYCRWHWEQGSDDEKFWKNYKLGYRYLWRKNNGEIILKKRQAIIPSAKEQIDLINKAIEAGWFIKCEDEKQHQYIIDKPLIQIVDSSDSFPVAWYETSLREGSNYKSTTEIVEFEKKTCEVRISIPLIPNISGYLCYMYCRWYSNDPDDIKFWGKSQNFGYRYIWRTIKGGILSSKRLPVIPSAHIQLRLINEAIEADWFIKCEDISKHNKYISNIDAFSRIIKESEYKHD